MTVEQLKEKYAAIKHEAAGIEAELKPLFKRLRSLSKLATHVEYSMQNEEGLYGSLPDGRQYADGWNIQAHVRMEELVEVPVFIKGIMDTLYNLRHTPFKKKSAKRGKQ